MTTAPYPRVDGNQACADDGVDPEIFFPRKGGTADIVRALAICGRCDFREPCAAYALTHDVRGVWGGLSESTRREIQRRHGIHPQALELSDRAARADEVRHLAASGTPPA